jgi:hypothetical protein
MAAALILPLALSPANLPGEASVGSETRAAELSAAAPLKGDEKLLLVLNRFTYGPRRSDLEHLRAIGLQAWFDQQLSPQKIDDSALEKRLADYPAMQLPLKELMERYPNQQVIRKMMNGDAVRPGGEAEKAIYNDSIARYKEKLAKKNTADAAKSAPDNDADAPFPTSAFPLSASSLRSSSKPCASPPHPKSVSSSSPGSPRISSKLSRHSPRRRALSPPKTSKLSFCAISTPSGSSTK